MFETLRALENTLPDGLRQAEDFFAETQDIEHALAPIFIYDAVSHAMLAANAAALRLYGYSEAEFLRLSLYDVRPPEEVERVRNFLSDGWPPGLRHAGVWHHQARDGRVFSVSTIGLGVEFKGRPAILAIITDLTQTIRAPDATTASGNALFPFAEQMDEVCWIRRLDDRRLVYLSPAFERMFGLPLQAAYADQDVVLSLVHPEDAEAVRRYAFRTSPGPAWLEYRIRRPDGELRWLASRSFPLVDATGARMMAGTVEDVTERKLAEQGRLEAVEAQRDALVREVHHRIKNSLQGVTGLLRRFSAAHPRLAPLLAEAAAQIQSLAAVHGLQGRSAAGRVELCGLLRDVVSAAEVQMQARIEKSIPAHCEPCLAIGEKDAVPVALALNEIVVNALKHRQAGGPVRVAAVIDAAAGTAEIRIANPGRLPRDLNPAAGAAGSGLQLIRMLLPPRGARFELREQDGEVAASLLLKTPVVAACA